MKMRKLIVALLVAALCIVAPAIALEWGEEDLSTEGVLIVFPYSQTGNTYFDVAFGNEDVNTVYPGWCVDPSTDSIRNVWYEATLTNTTDLSPEWNKVNWVLNNKGNANYQSVQKAIWNILGLTYTVPTLIENQWNDAVVAQLESDAMAHDDFIPKCGQIWAVLAKPNGDNGQDIIIEVPMPPCPPPVPEFPTMMIPVFLVGSLMVAVNVLKKD